MRKGKEILRSHARHQRGIVFDQRILLEAQEEAIAFETTQQTQRRTVTKAKAMTMN